jgi:hypothetical protein
LHDTHGPGLHGTKVRLLAAIDLEDDGVTRDADIGDMSRPRRQGAGRGLVVKVARWSSWWRGVWAYSAVTSAMAVRAEASSTMVLFSA